jgi:hypothetical protein
MTWNPGDPYPGPHANGGWDTMAYWADLQQRQCLNDDNAVVLGHCVAGLIPAGYDDADALRFTGQCYELAELGLLDLPFCPGTSRLPIPQCLSQDEVAAVDYCQHGDGSDGFWNAICWGAMKDPAWWQQYINTQPCAGVSSPQSDATTTALPPGNGNGGRVTEPQRSNMLLYAGLGVGALVLVGGAVYLARKK